MLQALDVRDGHRVLEIGTGTGCRAALLCYRLGARRAASVDVDNRLVAPADMAGPAGLLVLLLDETTPSCRRADDYAGRTC